LLATFYSSKINEFNNLENEYINSLTISDEKIEYDLIIGVVE